MSTAVSAPVPVYIGVRWGILGCANCGHLEHVGDETAAAKAAEAAHRAEHEAAASP